MSAGIEKKIEQLEHLCDAWRKVYKVYNYDADALGFAQECVVSEIIAVSQGLIEVYHAEKEKFQVEKLSEA